MSETAERFRRVSTRFGQRVAEVPEDAWDRPAPCEGWVARDVVRHMVVWMPAFMAASGGPALPAGPRVEQDPAGAWAALSGGLQAILDDPEQSAKEITHPQAGTHTLENAIGMFHLGDILVHTWDLARAMGLDESLDPDEVSGMLIGLQPIDEVLRSSGHWSRTRTGSAD